MSRISRHTFLCLPECYDFPAHKLENIIYFMLNIQKGLGNLSQTDLSIDIIIGKSGMFLQKKSVPASILTSRTLISSWNVKAQVSTQFQPPRKLTLFGRLRRKADQADVQRSRVVLLGFHQHNYLHDMLREGQINSNSQSRLYYQGGIEFRSKS